MNKILGLKIKPNTIFVSIASYRDDVCNSTIKSLYNMAKNPELIYIGICQQNNSKEDEDSLYDIEFNNIKIIRIPHYQAKGPTYARYLCSTLWNGEEYFLQIDSHTSFVKDWDEKCINMIKELKDLNFSQKPILSHYPNEITKMNNYINTPTVVTRICKSYFNDRGMISFLGAEIFDCNNQYYNVPYIAGGMFFCESKFLEEVPFDPTLDYLFTGEEILHSIRFYTFNWDVFTPKENIVFHEYTRSNKPKIWTDNPNYSDMNAFNKVKQYIKLSNKTNLIDNEKHLYGLGPYRTVEDYYNFAGIDIKNKKVYKNFCRLNNIATQNDINLSNQITINNIDTDTDTNININKNNNKYLLYIILIIFIIIIIFIIYKNEILYYWSLY